MPVTTRSKSRALSAIQDRGRSQGSHRAKRPLSTSQKPRKRKPRNQKPRNQKPRNQKPRKQIRKQPESQEEERPQTPTTLSSPPLSETTLTHFACRTCSCPQGAFDFPVDSCVRCGHNMDKHYNQNHPWRAGCDYACERQDLVASILKMARDLRVIVIRATPMVGKTTLLRLLGYHILHQELDLEPVFIDWRCRNERDDLPYTQYLQQEASNWRELNAEWRANNPDARTIYLIDEAQGSYEEGDFWERTLKQHNTRHTPIFVLVCLYGATALSRKVEPKMESQAQLMDRIHRVELRQTGSGPYMLFKPEETLATVEKWALQNNFDHGEGTAEYIHTATDGHPGVVGLILQYFKICFDNLPKSIRYARKWSPELCNRIITEQHDELLTLVSAWGRGLWVTSAEEHANRCLKEPKYHPVTFPEVVDALREVARRPHGYVRVQENWDAFAFCYKMGFLHTEPYGPRNSTVKYIFASPIHRRFAYRRLFAGPEPGTSLKGLSLQQVCINAIARFSPSVLQNRSTQPRRGWGIPEAAFQDEMYCCLNYELRNLPILSEYAHTNEGRIDFYIFEKKWGIEVLQCGSSVNVARHAHRFKNGGKYQAWNILDDYIILNFCSKSTIQEIAIDDVKVQPHILQVAINPEEYTAEVYTHDKQLQTTLTLGEGRQRYEEFDPEAQYVSALEDRAQHMFREQEKAEQEMKRREEEMKRREEEMKRREEEMKQEMKQEMEQEIKKRKEIERELDQLRARATQ